MGKPSIVALLAAVLGLAGCAGLQRGPAVAQAADGFVIDTTRGVDQDEIDHPWLTARLRAMVRSVPDSAVLVSEACAMPRAGRGDRIFIFGAHVGGGVSTVAIAGRDSVTRVVDIEIEPGREPLYLVLSSYDPVIWRFSGATRRVSRAVLLAREAGSEGEPLVAATGLRGSVLSRAILGDCFEGFYAPEGMRAKAAAALVERFAGRPPTVLAGLYAPIIVRAPSGLAAKPTSALPPPPGYDPSEWRKALWFDEGELVAITPGAVKGGAPEPYDVLPMEFGLAQLVGSGQLRRTQDGYRIERPIARFPAGLFGAHSVSFCLAAGVPAPAGDLGHSVMVTEGDGEAARGIC